MVQIRRPRNRRRFTNYSSIFCFLLVIYQYFSGIIVIPPLDTIVDNVMVNDISYLSISSSTRNYDPEYGQTQDQEEQEQAPLGTLQCSSYYMDMEDEAESNIASEMVYWRNIESDKTFENYYQQKNRDNGEEKFLTFEPDVGGWNNIRMALETVIMLGISMGRTIVLPPETRIYLLNEREKLNEKQKFTFSVNDFFHFDKKQSTSSPIKFITMEDFLWNQAMNKGLFKHPDTQKTIFPPQNKTNWDGKKQNNVRTPIFDFLREHAYVDDDWDPMRCLSIFPSNSTLNTTKAKELLIKGPLPNVHSYTDNPVPVNASFIDRLKESQAKRMKGCFYNETMEKAPVVHFISQSMPKSTRMLVPFYSFLMFENWKQDTWTKRYVRDRFRYSDQVFCAAGRIVDSIRNIAREHDPVGNPDGLFHSMHIRRGDFQYKNTRKEASELIEASQDELKNNATLFIATDERNKTFFEPFKQRYNVLFLDDFTSLIDGLNTNYYGLMDQLIASRGVTFHGTYYSTFTAYINRLRGYYSIRDKEEGYEKGELQSFYFFPKGNKNDMKQYRSVQQPLWIREFPAAWRNIDEGIPAI